MKKQTHGRKDNMNECEVCKEIRFLLKHNNKEDFVSTNIARIIGIKDGEASGWYTDTEINYCPNCGSLISLRDRANIKDLEWLQTRINKQKGIEHSCGNQSVVCGIFTEDRKKAEEFLSNKEYHYATKGIDEIKLHCNNGELWIWKRWTGRERRYRFYKIAVDTNIQNSIFEELILPYTNHYCCSMEII